MPLSFCKALPLPPDMTTLIFLFRVCLEGESLGLQLSYSVNICLDVGVICGKGMGCRKVSLVNVLIVG